MKVSISIRDDLMAEVDAARGLVTRSAFVADMVRAGMRRSASAVTPDEGAVTSVSRKGGAPLPPVPGLPVEPPGGRSPEPVVKPSLQPLSPPVRKHSPTCLCGVCNPPRGLI